MTLHITSFRHNALSKKIKHVLLCCMLSLICGLVHAQPPMSPELKGELQNKNTFHEIMATVNAHYESKDPAHNPEIRREIKKWHRWAWWTSRHLDQNGDFVSFDKQNAAIEHVLRQLEKEDEPKERTNSGGWTAVGPYDVGGGIGRVDRLAFHPTDPNHIYAGTPGSGLWHTTNGGGWWTALNGFMPGLGVSGIIVDIDNPNTLYVLTGDGDSFINGGFIYARNSFGIMKSTDGGSHWSKHSNIAPDGTTFVGYKLIQSNDFHWVFLAATSDGLYRSTNYGLTWQRNTTIGSQNVFDIEQSINGYMYVCTANDVYISTDWGSSFTIVSQTEFSNPPDGSTTRTALAVSPGTPGVLYVNFAGEGLFYRSTDYGQNFTLMNGAGPQSPPYMTSFAVNPNDMNIVTCGNVQILVSTNGCASFPNVGTGNHADIHDLAYNPLNNIFYAATDGGVYQSTNNGIIWTPIYNGLNTTQYYHMGCGINNNAIVVAGSQDNGIHYRNGSGPFSLLYGGDGYDAKFKNNNNEFFYTLNEVLCRYTISTNQNDSLFSPGPGQSFFFGHLAVHPTRDDTVYAGYIGGVYRSFNNGATWSNIGQSGSNGFAAAGGLAVSAANPDRLYAANQMNLVRSDNLGTGWITISGNSGWPGGSPTITDIQTRSTNADEIWVTFGVYGGPKVLYSSNAGATWHNFTGTLPDLPVYCIEYTSDGDAYIGTDAGVYFMDFLMSDWVRFSNGLPIVPVTEVVVDEVNETLKAATFARGIWQSDLYSDCSPFLLLSGFVLGENFYQSNGFIETSQVLPGSYGNALRLRSPQKIIFENGFRANNNSYLRAVIGNCGQGVFNLTEEPSTILSKDAALKTLSAQAVIK